VLTLALGSLAAACGSGAPPATSPPAPGGESVEPDPFAAIERDLGGRLGVFALDLQTGAHLEHRADERFAMCSTFKWLLAAAVLLRADRGELALGDPIHYGAADLLDYAPVTKKNLPSGSMTIEALAEASVTLSDNTAANLLLEKVGGPSAITALAESLGDHVTRLDRTEPTLNENVEDDPRDTTSPRAMVKLMEALLAKRALTAPSRDKLLGWMKACETGLERLRAGFPSTWTVGDKTGAGARGAANDVAIAWPGPRAPILVASYLSGSSAEPRRVNGAHASVARAIAQRFR
jgi:beta-lactamase class A